MCPYLCTSEAGAAASLHALSARALHEGCLWDESLPEAATAWLREAFIIGVYVLI